MLPWYLAASSFLLPFNPLQEILKERGRKVRIFLVPLPPILPSSLPLLFIFPPTRPSKCVPIKEKRLDVSVGDWKGQGYHVDLRVVATNHIARGKGVGLMNIVYYISCCIRSGVTLRSVV